ncbi:hypothetical protein Tco_0783223 [Tanacetum coccineum]
MSTLAEHIIVAGAKNRPRMLDKSMYDSWASRILLFIKGKKHGRMMLDSIQNGPLVYPTIKKDGHIRTKKYFKLTEAQQLQDYYDVQATNILLLGLPPDVYALVNHQEASKDIWDKVKLLMKGTELSYQELLSQHEHHAKEVCITSERYSNPLALVANSLTLYNPSQSPQHIGSLVYPPPQKFTPLYAEPIHHHQHHTLVNPIQQSVSPQQYISSSVTQQPQAKYSQVESTLVVPMFQQGEDLIECINKSIAFLSDVALRFPPSNNQLRMSSNPCNQATIQDGRVIVQQVQG